MRLGITNAKIVGFISTFLLLLLSYFLMFISTRQMIKQSAMVDHTNKVINNLELLNSENKEIEYLYQGYISTKDPIYHKRFLSCVRHIDSLYNIVRQITNDNDKHQGRLDILKNALDDKVSSMKSAIGSFDPNSTNPVAMDSFHRVAYVGMQVGVVRKQIKLMQRLEDALLKQRTQKLNRFTAGIEILNLTSLIIAFILAISSFTTYRRENRAREKANQQSELYKTELETRIKELADVNKEIKELRNIEKFASTGRIARTIAHEVRNPLTNINLASEQLKEGIPTTEENTLLLEMVKRNSLRINQLISNLLNATKFSELSFEKISVNELINMALEFAEDRINLKHIQIEKNFASDIPDIAVDEDKMKIALLNIIVNAIEAMESQNGLLTITTESFGDKCRIIFEDNGIGMNEETMSKLFEPFFTDKENGNGLGLTNSQNIILNHKGRIEVDSIEGTGSSFTITLDIN